MFQVIKVKKINKKAQIPYKTHEQDLCYDVVATSREEVAPNVYKYGTGLAFELVRDGQVWNDDAVLCIDFRPRSSVWKTGMVLSNCVGTIDEDYRGEVSAVFYHVMTDMPPYEVGDRIGQIKFSCSVKCAFAEVDRLSTTERGTGGYGSTGK